MHQLSKYIILLFSLFISLTLATACKGGGDTPYVELNGKRFKVKDLQEQEVYAKRYERTKRSYYQSLGRLLDDFTEEKLFELAAKEEGIEGGTAGFRRNIRQSVPEPTDQAIQQEYASLKANPSSFVRDKSIDEVKNRLRSRLISRNYRAAMEDKIYELKRKYNYTKGPIARKYAKTSEEPTRGGDSAKVEVVEFSGFECGYCQKSQMVASELREKYGDKIRWVVKDYPLRPNVLDAHIASYCVQKEAPAKFWTFFDLLYEVPGVQNPLGEGSLPKNVRLGKSKLRELAVALGVDSQKYDTCVLDGGAQPAKNEILEDYQEGFQLGVEGIPHFFINGYPISGSQSFQSFDLIIDKELKRAN